MWPILRLLMKRALLGIPQAWSSRLISVAPFVLAPFMTFMSLLGLTPKETPPSMLNLLLGQWKARLWNLTVFPGLPRLGILGWLVMLTGVLSSLATWPRDVPLWEAPLTSTDMVTTG